MNSTPTCELVGCNDPGYWIVKEETVGLDSHSAMYMNNVHVIILCRACGYEPGEEDGYRDVREYKQCHEDKTLKYIIYAFKEKL